MKRIALIALCALCVLLVLSGDAIAGKIYRNNTKNPTAADSITMPAMLTNSSVVAQRKATSDKFVVNVNYPNGDSAWAAVIDSNDARVREDLSGGLYNYVLAFQVSDIDGDGREGVYTWTVKAVDTSGPSHSIYTGSMPVYSLNFYRMMDSVTAYLTEEYTNIIASDRGKVLVPTERTDGAYPTNAGRWKMKTGAGFGSGDSVNTNSSLDTDLDGDVDNGPRLIIDGDSTICIWVGANSTTHDTTTARCLIDTSTIDPRFFSNITFWAYVDMDHPHEGHCPGNAYSNSATDGDTPLKFIRVFLSSDTALATYYYKDFADTAVVRGWNKFVIAKSDFSKVGSIVWPVSDSSKPLLTVGFMVATDSVAGSSGMRDIRLMIDDVRINKRARPKFMFRLDDGHLSQYTHAYHVFRDFSFKPTTNVCGRAIEQGDSSGNLNTSDLAILYEDGWDIANHGWYSSESQISGSPMIDSLALAGTSLMNDRFIVNRNQSYILDLGFKRGAGFFAWPLDAYDSTAIQVMAERHNFATGGKLGGYADHADEIPEKAAGYRYTYPYNPWTSNSPEVDIDTVKAWISHAIERGIPLILGAHSFKGHLSLTATSTVSHESGGPAIGVGGLYSGTNAPDFVVDGAVADDADYMAYTNADGGGATSYVVCSLNTASTWYVSKSADNGWVDTVSFTWRIRGSATTDDDTLYLVLDTASTETLVLSDTIIGIPSTWTNYTVTVRRLSEGKVTGNDVNAGIRLKNTMNDANDTIAWSWLYVQVGDDSGTTTGYGTQMDTSYLRSICNELVAKQGLIDCVTLSEYFRTQGSGGRLATVLRQSTETLDSTVSIAAQIAEVVTINDTVQAVLDTLQAYYSSGRLTAATIDSILNALDASLSTSVMRQNEGITTAQVRAQVDGALDSLRLDHLLLTKPGVSVSPTDSTFFALLASKASNGAWSGYNNTTDALEAIRDRGDVAWITATGFSTLTAANIHDQCSRVMDSLRLDHLLLTKPGNSVAPADSSFFALLATKSAAGTWSNYNNATDALEAIRDRGDAAWITATGFSTLSVADVRAQISGALDSLKLDHLLLTKPGTGTQPTDSTFFALLVSSTTAGAWSNYVNTQAALQALRARGDAAWVTATGFSTFNPSTTPVEILASGGSAGKNAEEIIDDIWDEDTTGHKTDPNMGYWITQGGGGGGADSAAIVNGIMSLMGDTVALYASGAGAGVCGQGLGTMLVEPMDTSGADIVIYGAWVTIRNLLTDDEFSAYVGASGYASFAVFEDQAYEVMSSRTGYYIEVDTATVDSVTATVFPNGYNITIPTASDPYTCRLNGYIQNSFGTAVQNAMVRVCPDNSGAGKFGNVTVVSRCKTVTTNSAGAFSIDVIWSDSLAVRSGDSTFLYNITVLVADESAPGQWREFTVAERIRIPSEVSYNINLFIKED